MSQISKVNFVRARCVAFAASEMRGGSRPRTRGSSCSSHSSRASRAHRTRDHNIAGTVETAFRIPPFGSLMVDALQTVVARACQGCDVVVQTGK